MQVKDTLTKTQRDVIEELSKGEKNLEEILMEKRVSPVRFKQWKNDHAFNMALQEKVAQFYRQCNAILAAYSIDAAKRLIELSKSDKDESARKACLDIIEIAREAPSKIVTAMQKEPIETDAISPEKAAKMLAILAEDDYSNNSNIE